MRRSIVCLLAGLLICVFGCSGGGGGGGGDTSGSTPAGTTLVTIRLGQTREASSTGLPRVAASIPSSVTAVRITVTGPGREPVVTQESTVGRDEVTVSFTLPNGPNVNFLVEALNAGAQVIYRGERTANLVGTPLSLPITMVAIDNEPPVFGGLSAVGSINTTSMVLSWQPATDNLTPQEAIQYLIYQSPTPGGENFTAPPAFTPPPGSTTFTVGGLNPETNNCFVVRARDEFGNVDTNTVEKCAQTLPTPRPAISVSKSCTDASAPGQPVRITVTVTNTGNVPLNNVTCSDDAARVLEGVIPSPFDAGVSASLSGSYVPSTSPSTDTATCTGIGPDGQVVSASDSASCGITTTRQIVVAKSCTPRRVLGANIPVVVDIVATVRNAGNERLVNVSCSDTPAATLTGVPSSLDSGATARVTGTYNPAAPFTGPYTDTLTCNGTGEISQEIVRGSASATCNFPPPALSIGSRTCNLISETLPTVNFSAALTNTGSEPVTNISCTDDRAATVAGVPATLPPGATAALSATYSGNAPFTDTLTCTGTGELNISPVTVTNTFTCTPAPALQITNRTCTAANIGDGIVLVDPTRGVVTNTGNETLLSTTCTDSQNLSGITGLPPVLFNPSATSTVTGSYTSTGIAAPQSDVLTCSGTGAFSGTTVTATGTATCTVPPQIVVTGASCSRVVLSTGTAVSFTGAVVNDGGENLAGVSCSTNSTMAVSGVPTTLTVGGSATFSGGDVFTSTVAPTSLTVTCTGTGALSGQVATNSASTQCSTVIPGPAVLRGGRP